MTHQSRTYATEKFASQPGERWRLFLERVGTHSNDFGTRLARARVRIPSGTLWTSCMGVEPDFVTTGEQ